MTRICRGLLEFNGDDIEQREILKVTTKLLYMSLEKSTVSLTVDQFQKICIGMNRLKGESIESKEYINVINKLFMQQDYMILNARDISTILLSIREMKSSIERDNFIGTIMNHIDNRKNINDKLIFTNDDISKSCHSLSNISTNELIGNKLINLVYELIHNSTHIQLTTDNISDLFIGIRLFEPNSPEKYKFIDYYVKLLENAQIMPMNSYQFTAVFRGLNIITGNLLIELKLLKLVIPYLKPIGFTSHNQIPDTIYGLRLLRENTKEKEMLLNILYKSLLKTLNINNLQLNYNKNDILKIFSSINSITFNNNINRNELLLLIIEILKNNLNDKQFNSQEITLLLTSINGFEGKYLNEWKFFDIINQLINNSLKNDLYFNGNEIISMFSLLGHKNHAYRTKSILFLMKILKQININTNNNNINNNTVKLTLKNYLDLMHYIRNIRISDNIIVKDLLIYIIKLIKTVNLNELNNESIILTNNTIVTILNGLYICNTSSNEEQLFIETINEILLNPLIIKTYKNETYIISEIYASLTHLSADYNKETLKLFQNIVKLFQNNINNININ